MVSKLLKSLYIAVVYLFLYMPILVVIMYSFNKNPDNLTKSYRRFETPVGSGAEVSSSIGESCSAFSATSCKDFSAVGVRHSLSEAVLHLSVTFLGLICSEH